jgi:hypothetical protein
LGALLYVLDVVSSIQPSNPAAAQRLLIEAAAAVDALPLSSSEEDSVFRISRGACNNHTDRGGKSSNELITGRPVSAW